MCSSSLLLEKEGRIDIPSTLLSLSCNVMGAFPFGFYSETAMPCLFDIQIFVVMRETCIEMGKTV